MSLINALFTPPTFKDADQSRTARLLHSYLLLNLGVNAVSLPVLLYFMPVVVPFVLLSTAFTFLFMALNRRGQVQLAGAAAIVLLMLPVFIRMALEPASYSSNIAISIVYIIAAAFVFGLRGLLAILALNVGLSLFTAAFKYSSLTTATARQTFVFEVIGHIFLFGVASVVVSVAVRALAVALLEARASESRLKQANQELEQRVAERTAQIVQSETHFRSLIENSRDMVSIIRPNGEVVYQSPALERMLGYKPEQVVGLNVFAVIHPEDVMTTQAALHLLQAEDSAPVFESRFHHIENRWVHLEMTGRVMAHGEHKGNIVINSRDISERKLAEQQMRRQLGAEAVVADVSHRFTRTEPGQLDCAIRFALQRVGEFVGVDIARLFLLNGDQLTNTHEWCGDGIVSQLPAMLNELFYVKNDWWQQQLRASHVIKATAIEELPEEISLFKKDLRRRGVESLVTVPLMRGGILLGEVGFDTVQRTKIWNDDDIRLLRLVSEMIVSVLDREYMGQALRAERNLLEQRVNERTRELSKLLDASRAINSTLQLQPLLGRVMAELKEVVPYLSAGISELKPNLDLHMLSYSGPVPEDELVRVWHYDAQTDVHIAELARTHMPVLINDAQDDTALALALKQRYIRHVGKMPDNVASVLHVPLMVRDQPIGLLTLTSDRANQYEPAQAQLAMTFANQAAVAIENARLHETEVHAAALAERSRLARELHDSVSQALFGIVLGSRTLLQKAAGQAELVEPAEYVLQLSEAALAEMRALIFELRPESLQQEGLIAAFQKQAEALCARHHIQVNTRLGHLEPPISIEAKEALYRIGLEAIQNTIKHANATHVNLWLDVNSERVQLQVGDNGVGFAPDADFSGHFGLRIMRERAEKCGGTLEVASALGKGARVQVQLPMGCIGG